MLLPQHTDDQRAAAAVVKRLCDLTPALATDLVRGGALGAVMRLTRRVVAAHSARDRSDAATTSLLALAPMLCTVARTVPQVAAFSLLSRYVKEMIWSALAAVCRLPGALRRMVARFLVTCCTRCNDVKHTRRSLPLARRTAPQGKIILCAPEATM